MTLWRKKSIARAAAAPFKSLMLASLSFTMAACSIPTTVQRMGVGYNNAAANLSDQLALLNIVRASRGYPLHYTSLTRLSGSITLKGTAGIGSQFNSTGHETDTDTKTDAAANTVEITKKVTSAAHQFTPSLGVEVDSNPSFDIDVNDTKEFYQGILSAIEPSTIVDLLIQGYDRDELMGLTVGKVKFVQKSNLKGFNGSVGDSLLTILNSDAPTVLADRRQAAHILQLRNLVDCYDFVLDSPEPTVIAPLSRITGRSERAKTNLTIKDLAELDGTKLDLSRPIDASVSKDAATLIVRPSDKVVGRFVWAKDLCSQMKETDVKIHGRPEKIYMPLTPPQDRLFVGNGQMMVLVGSEPDLVDVDPSVVFRSPEAVIEFLGECLRASGNYGTQTCSFDGIVLFELRRGQPEPGDVSVDFGREHYFINASGRNGPVSLRTLGLIEKLIDLHKSSADKPTTQPVHIVS